MKKKPTPRFLLLGLRVVIPLCVVVVIFAIRRLYDPFIPHRPSIPSAADEAFTGPAKVAFLFLVRRHLPLDFVWEHFFKVSGGSPSVYMHSRPGFVFDAVTTQCTYCQGRQLINSVQVAWGGASMIEAERLLLTEALKDKANQRFVLLSDRQMKRRASAETFDPISLENFDALESWVQVDGHNVLTEEDVQWITLEAQASLNEDEDFEVPNDDDEVGEADEDFDEGGGDDDDDDDDDDHGDGGDEGDIDPRLSLQDMDELDRILNEDPSFFYAAFLCTTSAVYDYLMSSSKSFVDSFLDLKDERYDPKMHPAIPKDHWRKGSQWITVIRKHAHHIVSDDVTITSFKKHCKRLQGLNVEKGLSSKRIVQKKHDCIPDEHYVQTLLSMKDLENELERRTLTYTLWNASASATGKEGWHPTTFKYTDVDLPRVQEIKAIDHIYYETEFRTQWCQSNATLVPCFLFARKFSKGAAMRLLTEQVIGDFDPGSLLGA